MLKKLILALLAILVIIQVFRPAKNLSNDNTYHISKKYSIPGNVQTLLEGACYDCHSNKTEYPWYAEIQPSAWWLANHVNEGKEHLNFSEFTNRKLSYQNHKFEEIVELVEEKEMPLKSYTWFGLHPEAKLTDEERDEIITWANVHMDYLRATYPTDSLVRGR